MTRSDTSPTRTIDCDVLVVGSGASGLACAVTAAEEGLDVVVAEKAAVFGGTSAWSGGWLWIPGNPLAVAAGIDEGPKPPRRYLAHLLGNRAGDPRLGKFLEAGPRMVAYFDRIGAVAWQDGNAVPDFYDHDGAVGGGRSVTAAPFDGRRLGPLIDRLRPPLEVLTVGGMAVASGADIGHFFRARRSPRSLWHVTKRFARHWRDLARHRRSMHLVGGNALVAHLLRAADARGVRLWSEAPVTELLCDGDRVTGAVVSRPDGATNVQARRGVVLAAGGFPHEAVRQAGLFPHVGTRPHRSAAPGSNTGDGLALAESVGGAVDTTLAQPAAWAPVSLVPDGKGGTSAFPHLVDRAKPGIIAVADDGRRFVNEAESYHDFTAALLARTREGADPAAWLIADARAQRAYGLGWAKPFPFPLGRALASGYLRRGRTLAELARACDLPASALEKTVARFNAAARDGRDPDFGRGATPYNRVQGWADAGWPNPSLAPLDQAPFYAVRLVPGSLGTFAGLRTSPEGAVIGVGDRPVPGLFAIGNDAASVMGGHYPSGGITLGPGMTFGFLVGRHLAGRGPGLDETLTHPTEETT